VATGALAISNTLAPTSDFALHSFSIHFDIAPVTSELLVITLDSVDGAAYDTVIFSCDPSVLAATDIVQHWPQGLPFVRGDKLVVTYANTDARTYGLRLTWQEI
jgi:hypothetical protein